MIRAYSPTLHFTDLLGHPLRGGTLSTFVSGTTNPIATDKDAQGHKNTPVIVLDSRGECEIWLDSRIKYRFELRDKDGVLIWSKDEISTASTEIMGDYYTKDEVNEMMEDSISFSKFDTDGSDRIIIKTVRGTNG